VTATVGGAECWRRNIPLVVLLVLIAMLFSPTRPAASHDESEACRTAPIRRSTPDCIVRPREALLAKPWNQGSARAELYAEVRFGDVARWTSNVLGSARSFMLVLAIVSFGR
jgi:hypothetical protein